MKHSLFRLTQKVYNTPHLITPEAFTVILDYLDARNSGSLDIYEDGPFENEPESSDYSDGMAVLSVSGSLTYKPVMTMCGEAGTSYQSLVGQVEEMASAGVRTIVMWVDSGGGEASHVFQACEDIRAICDENNIKLVGYADTMACSAAYALIAICDEVVANPSASLGSIGCVVALMDASKAMEQAGLKRIFVTSGENKVPFAEDGSFKESFIADIQESVDKLNTEFTDHVSRYTGLSADEIMGFQAKVFDADKALELGLANKMMTNKQFVAYVAELHKGN
jgi:ClpP class serine protease